MFNNKQKALRQKFIYGKSSYKDSSFSKRTPASSYLLKKSHPLLIKFKKVGILALITATLAFSIYLIFFSNFFKITQINLSEKNIENQALGEKIKTSISNAIGRNLLFIDTEDLKLKILSTFPEIEEVTLGKDYPKEITVEFTEYSMAANVIAETPSIKKSYIINTVGYVVKEDMENTNLPYIKIQSEESMNLEMPIIEATKLKYILDAVKYFEDKFGMRVIEVEYKRIPREIHILTEKNFYIWIDIQKPFEEQFKKLKKALVKLDIFNETLEYIDLRIAGGNGDKIIYKRLGT